MISLRCRRLVGILSLWIILGPGCSEQADPQRNDDVAPADVSDRDVGFAACVPAAEMPPFGACDALTPIATEVRTVIDLRDNGAGFAGRCDDTTDVGASFFNAYPLPTDPAAYPLLVRLSARDFAGPCAFCPDNVEDGLSTTYGVGFRVRRCEAFDADGNCTDGGLDSRRNLVLAMRVNEPWRVGAGGCGEACAFPCADGNQEFEPSTCASVYSTELGVHTTATNPPDAEVYVDLVANNYRPCCPFACP